MAATITNQDLNNNNSNNSSQNTNQMDPSAQNKTTNANQSALNQIASNYGSSGSSNSSSGSASPSATGVSQQSDNQTLTQPTSNPNQQKGTGYTNTQDFVNANKNNQLANTIGSGIQNTATNAQNDIASQQSDFNTQSAANQANTSANQQLVGNVLGNASNYVGSGANAGQGAQFQQLLSGVYQGPSGLANSQQIQSQAQDVGQLNSNLSNAGGQQSLLQRFVGNPQYTQGEQGLDTLLLGQGPQTALTQARASTAGLQNQANNAVSGAQAQAAQYANQAQQFGQQAQNQLGTYVNNQNNALTQAAQSAQTQRDTDVTALQTAANNGTLNPQLAGQLGITAGSNTYGVNAGNYISENPQTANAQNIASAQQYGNLNALSQLAGSYAPSAASSVLGQFSNPTQAGTYMAAPEYSANQTAYQTALAGGQAAYQNDLASQQTAQANLAAAGFNLPANYNPANDPSYQGTGSLNYNANTKGLINSYEAAQQAALAQLGGTYTYGR